MEQYRPLIDSICRRFLRRPEDVEDAGQETFLRLARHAREVHEPAAAWVATTAYSATIDLIRRSAREQQRRKELAKLRPTALSSHWLRRQIEEKLAQAMRELDARGRELLTERFLRGTPLRILAGRHNLSVATISRRTTAALEDLAAVLADMGVRSADELTLGDDLGDSVCVEELPGDDTLHLAPDWRAGDDFAARADPSSVSPYLPGWSRPIRVGVLISYRSTIVTGRDGHYWPADLQLSSTRWIPHQGVQLVSVIEPDTAQRGPIECAMREHELIGGLIDACDTEALRTLDVILLGWNRSLSDREARAIIGAVRCGVGLLNEYWTGDYERMRTSPDLQTLMLAASPIYTHHVAIHGQNAPAHLVREHPLLSGLKPGTAMPARGCGPVYKPADGASVLTVGETIISEQEHHITGLGSLPMPVCLAGRIGRGRVWVMNAFPHNRLAPYLPISFSSYLTNVLLWLAEPRRR